MVCSRQGGQAGRAEINVRPNGELLEEVESFKYLGSVISKGVGVSKDVSQRVSDEEYLESERGGNESKERTV